MGQYIQVNGDYNIKAVADLVNGGRITLDTGPGVGTTRITGNLLVEGDTVYVSSTQLDIEDNIITVNKGEAGNGVTLDFSGMRVDRGTLGFSSILWNENISVPSPQIGEGGESDGGWQFASGPEGTYSFNNSRLKLRQIVTESTVDDGDLLLIGTGSGVVKVGNRSLDTPGVPNYNYEELVTDDDDVPNKKYVDDSIQNNPTFQIVSNPEGGRTSSSRVIVTDRDTAGSTDYFETTTGYSTNGESAISIIAQGSQAAQFYSNRVNIFDLKFEGSEISTTANVTNENIKFNTQGTGKVEFNSALQLDHLAGSPAPLPNITMLHAAAPSVGDSGIWFVNNNSQVNLREGELISKRKALLFSMIF
jgi:hypothetical protein